MKQDTPDLKRKSKTTSNREMSNREKMNKDARETAQIYLKRTPNYAVIQEQIKEFEQAKKQYIKAKDTNNADICQENIDKLTAIAKNLKNIAMGRGGKTVTPTTKTPKIKELESEKTSLLAIKKQYSASMWIDKYKQAREVINKTENIFAIRVNTPEEKEKFDKILKDQKQNFFNIANEISIILGLKSPKNVLELADTRIYHLLKEKLVTKYKQVQSEIEKVDNSIALEKADTASDNYQFEKMVLEVMEVDKADPETIDPNSKKGRHARNMLTCAYVGLVQKIANAVCLKFGATNVIEDATSAGYLGLATAVDVWFKRAKSVENPIPFPTFANPYISGQIKKEILNLKSMGMIKGSTFSNKIVEQRKLVSQFFDANKELLSDLSDTEKEILAKDLIDNDIEAINNITTESDTIATYSGKKDDESVETWSNALVDDSKGIDEIKTINDNYVAMMNAVGQLLSLFSSSKIDEKENKIIPIKNGQKALFDRYDKMIFLMEFGFIKNVFEYTDPSKRKKRINTGFTHEQIAQRISQMKAEEFLGRTPTQEEINYYKYDRSAVSVRIKKILEKLKRAMEIQPSLKKGFEYFLNKQAELSIASQEMEKVQIEMVTANNTNQQQQHTLEHTFNNVSNPELVSGFVNMYSKAI